MPLASMLCPTSGRWVVVMGLSLLRSMLRMPGDGRNQRRDAGPGSCSVVVAEDEICHTARLRLALDLIRQAVHGFGALAVEIFDLGQVDVHPDPGADPQGRREADLVQPVIEDDAEALDRADLPEEAGGEAKGQEPVLHCGPERP